MVKNYLGESGFSVTIAPTGQAGLALHGRQEFDALILDLMLPDMDGLDICRKIRTGAQTPILMLTARGDTMDRVVGLEIGADDYLPKPFDPRELLARLRAILRRSKGGDEQSELMRFGRLEIDLGAREVRLDGEVSTITGCQFGARPPCGTRDVARDDHGYHEERAARRFRPLDRRAYLSHPRRNRG